jgi:hypothetical protein
VDASASQTIGSTPGQNDVVATEIKQAIETRWDLCQLNMQAVQVHTAHTACTLGYTHCMHAVLLLSQHIRKLN